MFSNVTNAGMAYTYNKRTQVTPASTAGDVFDLSWNTDQILQCYENCPKPVAADGATLQNIGFDNTAFNARVTHAFEAATGGSNKFYIHKADDFSLYYCGTTAASCVDTANQKVSCADCVKGTDNDHYSEGRFVANGATITNDNQLYATDLTYYRWHTGTWDNAVYPKKADNSLVVIERPLRFDYTHTAANKRNTSDVITTANYQLEYAGDGDLWGIGWECNTATGECTPDANIADGVMVDTTGNGTNDSIVLAIRVDLRGSNEAESTCTGAPHNLNVANPASPKTLQTALSTSAMSRITHTWADLATLEVIASGEPCVILGVNQSDVTGCSTAD
jgi:hypothetical protein